MRKAVIISMFVGCLLAQNQTWKFSTGPTEMSNNFKITFPMDPEHYAKFVEQFAGDGRVIPIRKGPANLSANALYGNNFKVGGKNRGWIIDGDDTKGWVLYLDWKGDGDLSATAPQAMEHTNGVYRLRVEVSEGETHWPCVFEVARLSVQGKEQFAVRISDTTLRRGRSRSMANGFHFGLTDRLAYTTGPATPYRWIDLGPVKSINTKPPTAIST